ncbi:MAG: beta-lactamase family protein [Pleurocapsa sp. SU_196_0]|nr:beta-lactamase family protein [Pleurocapsa sp. SU_196_0]
MNQTIQSLLERHIRDDGFAGAAVVAVKHGETVLEVHAGHAAPGLPSSRDALWPVASISKMYAVAALMRLVERGEITLNTLASGLIPQFTGDGREDIRLRHLLTHTSGLIYESPQMEARLVAQVPLEILLEEALTAPLQFRPGSSLAYADYNTLIAGRMAEIATGRTLSDLVRELVLEPMGLRDTYFPTPSELDSRVAVVRGVMAEGTNGAMYNSRYARSLAHPAFAVIASVTDLARFGTHFAPSGPRVHSPATVRAMTRDQTGVVTGIHPSMKGYDHTASMPWGLGWALQTRWTPALLTELASFSAFGHGGATGCELVIDPEADLVVAVVSNTHLRVGREEWYWRLQSILNTVFSEFA